MSQFCYRDETCTDSCYITFLLSLNSKQKAVLSAYQSGLESNHYSLISCNADIHALHMYLLVQQDFICLLVLNCYIPIPIAVKAFMRSICNKRIAGAYLNLLIGKNLHIHPTGNQSGDITVHATGWHPPLLHTKS